VLKTSEKVFFLDVRENCLPLEIDLRKPSDQFLPSPILCVRKIIFRRELKKNGIFFEFPKKIIFLDLTQNKYLSVLRIINPRNYFYKFYL